MPPGARSPQQLTAGTLQRTCGCKMKSGGGGKCEACQDKAPSLQRRGTDRTEPVAAPPIVHEVLRSPGQPLDSNARNFMEPRFGRDFSRVRVHTDAKAAQSSLAVNALAYTVGNNIVFGSNAYAPGSSGGLKLLAHELTHVVQQSATPSPPDTLTIGDPHDTYEREADAVKDGLAYGPLTAGATTPVVQRTAHPVVMRTELFSSTISICHALLESRKFNLSKGGVRVAIDAYWEGPDEGAASCETHRTSTYNVTLGQEGFIFDSEYGTCEFDPQRLSTRIWSGLPPDTYYLTIWTNNTNPNCCLKGNIQVSEEANPQGESCTEIPDDALTILHSALDLAGLIPVLGAIPDGINAGIYSIEGDWVNAGLSAAAMVPIFGEGVTVTKLGVKVTRAAVKRLGKESLVLALKEAKAVRGVAKIVKKIAGTRGLLHSFDRHAHEWFGLARNAVSKERHLGQWQHLVERAAESSKVFDWKLVKDEVTGHLAYFQGTIGDVTLQHGKHFAVFFYKSGPRAGELASAFVPDAGQLTQMLKLVQ